MKGAKRRFFVYHFSPDKPTIHVVVRMKDTPGALNRVVEALSRHVNLIGSLSYSTPDGTAVWSGFAETLSKSDTEAEIKNLLDKVEVVTESTVSSSVDGLLLDGFHTGIEVELGEDFILLPTKGISHTYDHLTEILGSGGDTILYDEGFSLGQHNARYFLKLLGPDMTRRKFAQLSVLYSSLGWGRVQLREDNYGASFDIVVQDCFECSALRKVRTTCSFLRGHLTGFLSLVFESDLKSVETECRFRGDAACRFRLAQESVPPFH